MADKDDGGKHGYKALATIAALIGALVARKSLAFAWKIATGKEPPANPEHPAVTWPEAITWAVVSGAVVGLARLAAQKKVAASWHRSTGTLPPDVEKTAA
jgi:CDP-diglyceride synthetase